MATSDETPSSHLEKAIRISRTPPLEVLRALRKEVGFGCPIPGCGNPYLEYHHFDPPFNIEMHHRPEGMIALCAEHHRKADAGAFTVNQLREFKNNTTAAEAVKGSFDWLRHDLVAHIGGIFYYKTLDIALIDDQKVIWFTRDQEGYLRLNVKMLSLRPAERAIITENFWENIGSPVDLESPPSGKKLKIKYQNGDFLEIQFFEICSFEEARKKFNNNDSLRRAPDIQFPITIVQVSYIVAGAGINLLPTGTTLGGVTIGQGLAMNCGAGFTIPVSGQFWRENPSRQIFHGLWLMPPCSCKKRGDWGRWCPCRGHYKSKASG